MRTEDSPLFAKLWGSGPNSGKPELKSVESLREIQRARFDN